MRFDKVVIRTLLSTLLAIVILLITLILLLCLAFPSTMMEMTYKMGMDGASVKYAMRAYNQTGSVQYVAFAMETAIGADDFSDVERCGLQLIADEDFLVYCESRNQNIDTTVMTYQQYVYSQVSIAQYSIDKKSEAQDTAFTGVGNTFPQNNAVVGLMITAITRQDGATVTEIKIKMQSLLPNVTDVAQAQYLQEAITLCVNAGY